MLNRCPLMALVAGILYLMVNLVGYKVYAQCFTPSPDWQNTTISGSLESRIQLASDALDTAFKKIDKGNGSFKDADGQAKEFSSAYLYGQMSEFDLISGQRRYSDLVSKYLPLALETAQAEKTIYYTRNNNTEWNLRLQLIYARSAILASFAYNDANFLETAKALWELGNEYTLSDADIEAGHQLSGKKNFSLQKECGGNTIAGGSFCNAFSNDACMSAHTSGYFLGLSSLLYNATSNTTYLTAARRSLDWMLVHTLDSTNGLIIESLPQFANQSDSATCLTPPKIYAAHGSGLLIDGLSYLISFTKNTSNEELLFNAVIAAITNGTWENQQGVVNYDVVNLQKSIELFHSLGMAVTLESSPPCMKSYIKDYVAIQYNAILENARMPDSATYGGPWIGPPSSHFSPYSQAGAIQVLLSAINEDNNSAPNITSISPNSPTTSDHPSSSDSTKSGSHTGIIVGATVGAAIFLMLALGSAIYCFVHRQKQASNSPVTPFLSQNSSNVRSGSGIISRTDVKTSTHHMEVVTNPADEIDTPELIRVLNQRLHMEQHPGETPPPYHGPEGRV